MCSLSLWTLKNSSVAKPVRDAALEPEVSNYPLEEGSTGLKYPFCRKKIYDSHAYVSLQARKSHVLSGGPSSSFCSHLEPSLTTTSVLRY